MSTTPQISSRTLVLIVVSIAINMIGGQITSMVKLPIFLDSIGTLICALLGGPWVALFTGLLTNLLWGLIRSNSGCICTCCHDDRIKCRFISAQAVFVH